MEIAITNIEKPKLDERTDNKIEESHRKTISYLNNEEEELKGNPY